MSKSFFTIVIFVAAAFSFTNVSAQLYSYDDTISIVSGNGSPGQDISLDIDCVNTFSIAAVNYRITFDTDVFEFYSIDLTDRSAGYSYSAFNLEVPGVIRYVGAAFDDPWANMILPGSGPINVINLRILDTAANGEHYLRFENTDSLSFQNGISDSTGSDVIIPIFNDGFVAVGPTGIDDIEILQPESFDLLQNYPNPFNMETKISFILENRSQVTLDVYNLLGRKVATLFDGEADAGITSVRWNGLGSDGREVTSGVYFYKVGISDGRSITKRMALIK